MNENLTFLNIDEIKLDSVDDCIKFLEKADQIYFEGFEGISDKQYDTLKVAVKKIYPDHKYFQKVGAPVTSSKNKVKLPLPMGSLDQVYNAVEYLKWIQKYNISEEIISDKLDGMSGCVKFSNGKLVAGYSRGNGIEGGDILKHLEHVSSIPNKIDYSGDILIRGELIYKKQTFDTLFSKEYANARNMVSGVFNRKESSPNYLNHVDFVVYEVMNQIEGITTKEKELNFLKELGFLVVPFKIINKMLKNINLDNETFLRKNSSLYELDGIVITNNDKNSDKLSNSSSLNPEHSVKYKLISKDDFLQTQVLEVEWNLSKNGYLKPRVRISPVSLFGTTVEYVTAFNAGTVESMGIGPGAVITITKAGTVIPYIVDVIKKSTDEMINNIPPNVKWNSTHVELMLIDADNDEEVKFQQILYFFTSLDVDNLKEGSLRSLFKFYDLGKKSYEEILSILINLLETEYRKVIGENGSKIYNSLQRKLENLSYEKFLGAIKYFGASFGERKFKNIISQLDDPQNIWDITYDKALTLFGVDTKTADMMVGGMKESKDLLNRLNLSLKKELKTTEFKDFVVVMTGFRDHEFQESMEKKMAKFTNSVSKNTTHLLVADKNSNSTKTKKAKELNIPILTLDEFKNEFNL